MLPEHVRMLHNLWDEQQKVSNPILDEQQLQLFDEKICEQWLTLVK
jgi:YolD-like protein